jgi:proteasome alpha subunit
MEFLEKKYDENIDLDGAIILGLEALKSLTETELVESTIEIGVIELSTGKFRKLISSEVKKYVSKIVTEIQDKGTKGKKK